MSGPVCDDSGLELPPHTIKVAAKWLVWQHGMTSEEADKVLARRPGGPIRQRQRQEAIDVADFVEHLGHV